MKYPVDYYNRKGWHSILIEGTVNHVGLFTDVYIGWPGRVHDAKVFANSTLYRMVSCFQLTEHVGDHHIGLAILGDAPYPFLSSLLKAFPDTGRRTC